MATPLREVFAEFSVKFDGKQLEKGEKQTSKAAEAIKRLGLAIGGAAIVRGLQNFTTNILHQTDAITKVALQTGISARALQEWNFVAQSVGLETDKVRTAMLDLGERIGKASDGAENFQKQFKRLGISVEDLRSQSPEQIFDRVASGLASVENQGDRTFIANELLGGSGKELNAVWALGAENLKELRTEVQRAGGGFSQLALDNSEKLRFAIAKVSLGFDNFRNIFAERVLPKITEFIERQGPRFFNVLKRIATSPIFTKAFWAIAIVGVTALLAAMGPIGTIILTIAALAVVFDDLHNGVRGGQSAIDDWIFSWTNAHLEEHAFRWQEGFDNFIVGVVTAPSKIASALLKIVSSFLSTIEKTGNAILALPGVETILGITGGSSAVKALQNTISGLRQSANAGIQIAATDEADLRTNFARDRETARDFARRRRARETRILADAAAQNARVPATSAPSSQTSNTQVQVTQNITTSDPEAAGAAAARHVREVMNQQNRHAKAGTIGR